MPNAAPVTQSTSTICLTNRGKTDPSTFRTVPKSAEYKGEVKVRLEVIRGLTDARTTLLTQGLNFPCPGAIAAKHRLLSMDPSRVAKEADPPEV